LLEKAAVCSFLLRWQKVSGGPTQGRTEAVLRSLRPTIDSVWNTAQTQGAEIAQSVK